MFGQRAHTTYHLVPKAEWQAADPAQDYTPSTFDEDGFIHCTDGEDEVVATANRYYRQQSGSFLALEIDTTLVRRPIRYEDPRRIYPHVYGPLNRAAVVAVHRVERDHEGTFLALALSGEHTLESLAGSVPPPTEGLGLTWTEVRQRGWTPSEDSPHDS